MAISIDFGFIVFSVFILILILVPSFPLVFLSIIDKLIPRLNLLKKYQSITFDDHLDKNANLGRAEANTYFSFNNLTSP